MLFPLWCSNSCLKRWRSEVLLLQIFRVSPLHPGKCTKQVFHYLCFIVVQGLAAAKAEFLVEGATHKIPAGKAILQWVWGSADVAFKIKLFVRNWRLKNSSVWLTVLLKVIHCRKPILLHLHSTDVGQCRFVCCGVPRESSGSGRGGLQKEQGDPRMSNQSN